MYTWSFACIISRFSFQFTQVRFHGNLQPETAADLSSSSDSTFFGLGTISVDILSSFSCHVGAEVNKLGSKFMNRAGSLLSHWVVTTLCLCFQCIAVTSYSSYISCFLFLNLCQYHLKWLHLTVSLANQTGTLNTR